MRILLLGYGKMGKAVEKIAIERGHVIASKIDIDNPITGIKKENIDIAIEFTKPDAAENNIYECLNKGISVVSGTTGWNINVDEITTLCQKNKTSMFYASNFSVGMNIFMEINNKLASLLNKFDDYSAKIEETHHIQKLDEPSGTAISLAEGIIKSNNKYRNWELNNGENNILNLPVFSFREGDTVGNHRITWKSNVDKISIEHSAENRAGFAVGAILAAEYTFGKVGFYTMRDLLNL
jgi:4-hydroxy-tetrahydrodipicolinate reductase